MLVYKINSFLQKSAESLRDFLESALRSGDADNRHDAFHVLCVNVDGFPCESEDGSVYHKTVVRPNAVERRGAVCVLFIRDGKRETGFPAASKAYISEGP